MSGGKLPRFPIYAEGVLSNLLGALTAKRLGSTETLDEFKSWAYCVADKAELPPIDLSNVHTKSDVCNVLIAVLMPVFNEHEGHASLDEWDKRVQTAIKNCPFACCDIEQGAESGSPAGTAHKLPKSPSL